MDKPPLTQKSCSNLVAVAVAVLSNYIFPYLCIFSNVSVEVSQQYYGVCPWDSLKHTKDFIQETGIF